MNLDRELVTLIEMRLKRCEQQYQIRVLSWALRGSLAIGIYRKNSDLDLIFLYQCCGEKVSGIHDIVGYGLDFWGWDIQDALEMISLNHKNYYENPADFTKSVTLSPQHTRGSLDYFQGFYCFVGNSDAVSKSRLFPETKDLFQKIMEKRIVLSHFISRLNSFSSHITLHGSLNSHDYLYAVWMILISRHLLHNGLPGEWKIRYLMDQYLEPSCQGDMETLLDKYKTALSKGSQILRNDRLNDYIQRNNHTLATQFQKLRPENENCFDIYFEEIRNMIFRL